MEIHPDAPVNPLEEELTEMLNFEREQPVDWRRGGRPRHMDISEHNERIVKESLLETQRLALPTFNQMRNERNMSQLQERIYQKLLPHIDALNICILKSRTINQMDYCFSEYNQHFETNFKPSLKDLLLEY